ncbi:lactonase family protein [Microbacterium amylolyticum]|uniref:6-phosphogluconolactonase (Cycloisomerase 2 family) n=1 Tax=Microbacterium amylolyticum TaxID=936337 RepID=A0ABS4ZJ94_9MICO|nr:beta-propeller fold lactonase family protein [Microbacterium amylolyticum]MBP2437349.1 6-phosphogluconolactonase (cycloisomerase 2 family) [Microbacterium amylolyticum]
MRFWTGARGADMGADGTGIGAITAGDADSPLASGDLALRGLAVEAPSPTWLARHPHLDVVYAALEGSGRVGAYRRTGEESLTPLGKTVPAGEAVCHLAVAPDGTCLIASCWGDGRVVHIPLGADGSLDKPSLAPAAEDPYRAVVSQAAPSGFLLSEEPNEEEERPTRAHAAAFLPDGRVATTDLGYDLVRIWRLGTRGLVPDHQIVFPHGVGPRHMFVHPSGHLHVVTEFSCEVFTLAPDRAGAWRIVSACPAGGLLGDTAAELTASRDRQFVYAGLRGESNAIAVLRVEGNGESLRPIATADSGISVPRHHVIVRDALLVAGQNSNAIVSLSLDERTGLPGRVRHRLEHPTPQHILPIG